MAVQALVAAMCSSALTYAALGIRAQGPINRLGVRSMQIMLAGIVMMPWLHGWPPYRDSLFLGPGYLFVVSHLSIAITLVVVWPRRRSKQPLEKIPFDLGEYVFSAGVLVVFHWAVVQMVAGADPLFTGGDPVAAALANWLFFGPFVFLLSQMTSTAMIRSLYESLDRDWVFAEDSRHRRTYLFLWAALPVALCIIPSVAVGALLGGVLVKLIILLLAWRFTDLPPTGILKTLRQLRRSRTPVI